MKSFVRKMRKVVVAGIVVTPLLDVVLLFYKLILPHFGEELYIKDVKKSFYLCGLRRFTNA